MIGKKCMSSCPSLSISVAPLNGVRASKSKLRQINVEAVTQLQ